MINKYNAENIYLIGDTHSLDYVGILAHFGIENFILIHVGDSGEGFYSKNTDEFYINRLSEYCQKHNGQILTVRGNHSNPAFYESKHWSEQYSKVRFVKDYTYITINDKICLFVGGAVSVDRVDRQIDVDYWKDEGFKPHAELSSLKQCDILITHSSPISCWPQGFDKIKGWIQRDSALKDDLIVERNNIEALFQQVNPQCVFYGHFHNSVSEYIEGTYRRCLDINEIIDATTSFNASEVRPI